MSEYIISFLLVVLVSVFTVYPLFTGQKKSDRGEDSPQVNRLRQLYEKRDLYHSSIKDIELDRDMGKLSEPDYTELISRYKAKAAEAAELISRLQSEAEKNKTGVETNSSPFRTPVS